VAVETRGQDEPTQAAPMNDAEPVSLVHGDGGWVLVVDRVLAHPPARVWTALTDADDLAEWSPFSADRHLTSIGPVRLTMRDVEGEEPAEAVVRAVEPDALMEYSWGGDVLRWEVYAHAGGSRLVLRHHFADRAEAPSYAAGWILCLRSLQELLDTGDTHSRVGEAAMDNGWQELNEHYTGLLDA
jgi:uncharacterized protein YndB with AHSA1/START domain